MGAKALIVCVLTPALLSGCQLQRDVGFGRITTYYSGFSPAMDDRGVRSGAPLYLDEVESEGPEHPSMEAQLAYAIELMLHHDLTHGVEVTYWAGPCAPAADVGKVTIKGHVVTVELKGAIPDPVQCRLSLSEEEAQRQQLAWTVRGNIDPFSEEDLLVRVVGPDGDIWPEMAPDLNYIEPRHRPTPR